MEGENVDLTDLDDAYGKSAPPERPDDLPDGNYQVVIEDMEVRASEAGNRYLSWDLRVLAGECKGRHAFKRNMLQTAENLNFLKGDLAVAGLTLAKLSELPVRCKALIKTCLEIRVKAKGEFSNIYIKKRMGDAAPESSSPPPATPAPAQPAATGEKKDRF